MNKNIMKQAGFGNEVEKVEMGLCPTCSNSINTEDFRNPLSITDPIKLITKYRLGI